MNTSSSLSHKIPVLRRVVASLPIAACIAAASVAFGAGASSDHSAPSRQMREQMAAMHEQAAACLRSEKPIAECRNEMMQSCRKMKMMGGRDCSMMGMMGMGMGKRMPDHSTPNQKPDGDYP